MLFQNRRTQDRATRHVAPMLTGALALAAVVSFARPAAAQVGSNCGDEVTALCGTVWNDADHDGIQDATETPIGGVKVTIYDLYGTLVTDFYTDINGNYIFDLQTLTLGTTYIVAVDISSIGTGVAASPSDAGNDDTLDSDGIDDTMGTSSYTITIGDVKDIDFGFFTKTATQPGTGTPGYWKNHPSAWPSPYTNGITIGGVQYSKSEAIAILSKPGKDKRATMFSSLVSAILNVALGNDSSCVASTITAADAWMATWGVPNTDPIVTGDSAAWAVGEPLHKLMDAYNNGLLCAPHRN
jgi:SdrD B-like domain